MCCLCTFTVWHTGLEKSGMSPYFFPLYQRYLLDQNPPIRSWSPRSPQIILGASLHKISRGMFYLNKFSLSQFYVAHPLTFSGKITAEVYSSFQSSLQWLLLAHFSPLIRGLNFPWFLPMHTQAFLKNFKGKSQGQFLPRGEHCTTTILGPTYESCSTESSTSAEDAFHNLHVLLSGVSQGSRSI